MNRREALQWLATVVTGAFIGYKEGFKYLNDRLQNKICCSGDYVLLATTTAKIMVSGQEMPIEKRGCGVVLDDYYLTMNHITDCSTLYMPTPMGIMPFNVKYKDKKVTIDDYLLEEVKVDKASDVAVYKLPSGHGLKQFPYKPSDTVQVGQECIIIGNPHLNGVNIRRGYVSDLDGFLNEPHLFGTDIEVMPGDSGTPCISTTGHLLGLYSIGVGGVSYVVRISCFTDGLKAVWKGETKWTE